LYEVHTMNIFIEPLESLISSVELETKFELLDVDAGGTDDFRFLFDFEAFLGSVEDKLENVEAVFF
jgi:hypothetical protein